MTHEILSRRAFVAVSAATGGSILLTGQASAAADVKKTFTILHTNDMHSNLLGVGPVSEYTPASLKDDRTIGGIERIATLIAERRKAREAEGPVLVLDIGDFSIGTPFGGAIRETGAELQCLSLAGYDATTFGNHEFDSGPSALAEAIAVAKKAGHVPAILAANTNFDADDAELAGLKELARTKVLRSHMVIERGGIKFGLFGMMGLDSIQFTIDPGALTFPDPIETARNMVKQLREEGADVIICMSHGGVLEPKTGPITEGEDIELARAIPEIDVIVGGHTHTFVREPIIVNGTPVLQAGCYGRALGELVMEIDGRDRKVASYKLHSIDDTIPGDPRLAKAMEGFKAETSRIVFKPRGFRIDEPLAVIDRDWPNTFFDLEASLPLGNLMADCIRYATKADVAMSTAGMVRAGLMKGTHGAQTAYDLYLLAPLGIGVADQSGGGSLVVAYFTGREIKNSLEFLLVGNPNLPGQYFPRVSGMRFRYDPSRPKYDIVTQIELGDVTNGYHVIDMTEKSKDLYSVSCNLYFGLVLASIPAKSKGKLPLAPKKKDGTPMKSRADALPDLPQTGPFLLPPTGTIDNDQVVKGGGATSQLEIKEWQAIMDYLKSLPKKNDKGISLLDMDELSMEIRAIQVRA
jgi:5'-nucleotidase/UDP-sugar diphosphatase